SMLRPSGKIEIMLHTACVRAGAFAIAYGIIEHFSMAKSFLAKPVMQSLAKNSPLRIQKHLIKDIYKQHGLKPANWESSAIIAVAESSSGQLVDFRQLERKLKNSLGDPLAGWPLKAAPLAQWAPEMVAVVARTWAIGRYADSVGRIRKLGSDMLPAPMAKNLKLPANLLWHWTEEAFELALPVLGKIHAAGSRIKHG
ncbi:MAG: hypothetical protein RIS14_867, partial [Pseudomonadota bacterium]